MQTVSAIVADLKLIILQAIGFGKPWCADLLVLLLVVCPANFFKADISIELILVSGMVAHSFRHCFCHRETRQSPCPWRMLLEGVCNLIFCRPTVLTPTHQSVKFLSHSSTTCTCLTHSLCTEFCAVYNGRRIFAWASSWFQVVVATLKVACSPCCLQSKMGLSED